jgi:hypothetical protein
MRIKIEGDKTGMPPFDGEYPLPEFDEFDGDQLHLIKSVAGVRLNEFEEAAAAGDWDLVIAFAAIALQLERGTSPSLALPRLRKLKVGQLSMPRDERDDEREQKRTEEDGPPAQTSAPEPTPTALESEESTGTSGVTDSERSLAIAPSPTGGGGSESTSHSDPETSVA